MMHPHRGLETEALEKALAEIRKLNTKVERLQGELAREKRDADRLADEVRELKRLLCENCQHGRSPCVCRGNMMSLIGKLKEELAEVKTAAERRLQMYGAVLEERATLIEVLDRLKPVADMLASGSYMGIPIPASTMMHDAVYDTLKKLGRA